jgi:hypothetical protein
VLPAGQKMKVTLDSAVTIVLPKPVAS